MQHVGQERPGGRTARTALAVYAASGVELATYGVEDFRIERVAARAGVHRSTIYRRWGTKESLITETGMQAASDRIPLPDTGSLGRDLYDFIVSMAAVIQGDPAALSMFAGAVSHPDLAEPLRAFMADRLVTASLIVERAVARGDIPADTDTVEVIRAVAAPVYYCSIITHEPVTPAVIRRSVRAALAAIQAGCFAREDG